MRSEGGGAEGVEGAGGVEGRRGPGGRGRGQGGRRGGDMGGRRLRGGEGTCLVEWGCPCVPTDLVHAKFGRNVLPPATRRKQCQ